MASHSRSVFRLPCVPSFSGDDCRLLVHSVVDYAIFVLDLEGRIESWNLGAERIAGYRASEVIGQHFALFHTREDIDAGVPEHRLESARALGRAEDEGWRVRKDGSRFWANTILTALHDDDGMLRGFGNVTREIAARNAADERLHHAEERFRLLVDNVVDYAIYMLDPAGLVATWNLGAERMKGYTSTEIVGRPFHVFFPAEDVQLGKPDRELAMARELGRYEDEGWRVRKDGTRFWANAIVTALRDRQGELVGFAKITRDLTARRESEELERRLLQEAAARGAAEQAEDQLRLSENRYRALSQRLEIIIEGVADAITVQDASGRIIFANAAAAAACGFQSAEELVSTAPQDILARFEVLDEFGNAFEPSALPGRRVLEGAASDSALLCVKDQRTRAVRWQLVRAAAAQEADQQSRIAINIWHDVTQQRRQELHAKYLAAATTALGASLDANEMLGGVAQALVPGLADWCVVHLLSDGELCAVTVAHVDPEKVAAAKEYEARFPPERTQSRGAANVARTGKSELYSEISDALLAESVRDPARLCLLRAAGMKAAIFVPIVNRSQVIGVLSLVAAESGRRYDEADLMLAEELGHRMGIAVEHAQLYAAAQDAARAAEEASRAKDEFLAIVSHELRTPLNAIVGWSALLRERPIDASLAKPIEVIHRNAEAQVKIIDDILDVSRVITGKFRLEPKPMDLVAVAREAIDVVRTSAGAKRISIEFAPEGDFCLIVADPVRMQQVIWNLLSNAVKFTDRDGRILVSLRQAGSSVSFAVEDTGKGIEPGFLPFVFDRFKQADASITRRVGGLGLGLALVRHIVELHGGRVAAESEGLGRGSRFTIVLPIRAVTSSEPPRPPPFRRGSSSEARTIKLEGIRVLVVDDERDARELVEAVLVGAGAAVTTASSADQGWTTLQRFRPDVLISDLGMPDEDGLTFIRRVRMLSPEEGGRIPAIALTALARDEDRTVALRAGYTTHIGKPVDAHALAAAVANLATVNR